MAMQISVTIGVFIIGCLLTVVIGKKPCRPGRYENCMAPIYKSSYGHEHGLFQTADDLQGSCPILQDGINCIKTYGEECNTNGIAKDFVDQFERPMKLIDELCITKSTLKAEYLKHSPCLLENAKEFAACSDKIEGFLSTFKAENEQNEATLTCIFDSMFRSCWLSTAINSCGLDAGGFVMKALQYSPVSGLKTCFPDTLCSESSRDASVEN